MAFSRGTALSVGLIGTATVVGHVWLAEHYERRLDNLLSRTSEHIPRLVEIAEQPPDERSERAGLLTLELTAASYEVEAHDPDQPADALSLGEKAPAASIPSQQARSGRMSRQQMQDEAAVREVIEDEMSETGAEERDIWYEELKSLPAEAVRDMLQVRKHLRVLTPDHHLGGPGRLSPFEAADSGSDAREIVAEPAAQTRISAPGDWSDSRAALTRAVAWSLHNLANASTPGYKRWRVDLGEAYAMDDASAGNADVDRRAYRGVGCRIKSLSVDMRQGELAATGRELDVAIDGPGFFVVQHPDAQRNYYTRCGAWKLNGRGMLCQSVAGEDYLLDPPVVLPADAVSISISPDGVIAALRAEMEKPVEIGRIQLAMFLNPSQMPPRGDGLFEAPPDEAPGFAAPGADRLGRLRQHALEQSNVDVEQEQAERAGWEAILATLPTAEIPRTARHGARLPR